MLIRTDTLQPWFGEPINDIQHPANIEELWSAEELWEIGLAVPDSFIIPEGKMITGQPRYIHLPNGIGTEYDVVDIPPPAAPLELSRWQFFAAAALAGIITQQEAEDAITRPFARSIH